MQYINSEESRYTAIFFFIDCSDGYNRGLHVGKHTYATYDMKPHLHNHKITTLCQMWERGYTIFQRNFPPRFGWLRLDYFNKTWTVYKEGFGLPGIGWLGNDALHQITVNRTCWLEVFLMHDDRYHSKSYFKDFSVGDEASNYEMFVGELDDSYRNSIANMMNVADPALNVSGMPFSTYDRDNDQDNNHNCASESGGGWWFNACAASVLNAPMWGIERTQAYNSTLWSFWPNVTYDTSFMAVYCNE